MKNKQIDTEKCEHCNGTGRVIVWLAPRPCTPDCVKDLRYYYTSESGQEYWLCDACRPKFQGISVLWTAQERERCLEALGVKK